MTTDTRTVPAEKVEEVIAFLRSQEAECLSLAKSSTMDDAMLRSSAARYRKAAEALAAILPPRPLEPGRYRMRNGAGDYRGRAAVPR